MYELREKAPHKLSGGQKQRVAVAGIIAMKPKCIVLDEPTAMLDPSGRKEVIDTIKKLNNEDRITIILITHYMVQTAHRGFQHQTQHLLQLLKQQSDYRDSEKPFQHFYVFQKSVTADEIGLPVSENGGILPCGASAIWMK